MIGCSPQDNLPISMQLIIWQAFSARIRHYSLIVIDNLRLRLIFNRRITLAAASSSPVTPA